MLSAVSAFVLCVLPLAIAAPAASSVTTSVSTAVASAAASPNARVSLLPIPPRQYACQSDLYCNGQLLQTVQLAALFPDSKTFVDKPARYPTEQILAAFQNLTQSSNFTTAALVDFVDSNFLGEGLDIEPATIPDFSESPAFLSNVSDAVYAGWLKQVNGYWSQLARQNVQNVSCATCESSLIPLNHTCM